MRHVRRFPSWLLSALVVFCGTVPGGAAVAAAPKVVESSPAAGDLDVDPALAELRVVFDRPMKPTPWSVVRSGRGVFPELLDKPTWADERTFVWRVKLEPNTDYWLSVNGTGGRFTGFRSKDGNEPAEAHPISFSTRAAADAKPAPPEVAAANREAVARLRRAVDEEYAYRNLRKVDWEKRFAEFAARLEQARGPAEFASVAAKMLAAAQDTHLAVRAGERRVATFRRPDFFPAIDLRVLQRTVGKFARPHPFVFTGELEGGARYLCLGSLPAVAEDPKFLAAALDAIRGAAEARRPLVLDLRGNGGGDEPAARKIAGCFLDAPATYAAHVMRGGGKWSERRTRVVAPNPDGPKFRGKVVVLTGPATASSAESFVLMMKQAPGCVTVGMRTAGTSGNPKSIDLGNGTSVSVPQWQAMRPDGTVFEGEGIAPDVEVKAGAEGFKDADPILAEAVRRVGE
jgi:hypothetical protein